MDNPSKYGIRYFGHLSGMTQPKPIPLALASGVNFTINGGAQNNNLNIGDPVYQLSSGYATICGGYENAANVASPLFGIVAGFGRGYFDGRMFRPTNLLPSGVTYGTILERQTFVLVVPCTVGSLWEIDVDAATYNTDAGYRGIIGNNADHILTERADLSLLPQLHMAAGLGTGTAQWRIHQLSPTMANQDLTGANVKLIVTPNESQLALPGSATGV